MKPGIVSGTELATYLKVDRRTVNKLTLEGHVVRADSGQGFKLLESIQTYCVRMREAAAARVPSEDARAAKVQNWRELERGAIS